MALKTGRTSLNNLILESSPGDKNIKFKISSTAINYNLVQHLDSIAYADLIISVDFRWCKPGEIQIDNI